MSYFFFNKKINLEVINKPENMWKERSGYTVKSTGFPFAIYKKELNSEVPSSPVYWLIVNRFSGEGFSRRFSRKKDAEKFFYNFSNVFDVKSIDFKNPLYNFNYDRAYLKVINYIVASKRR